MCLQHINGNLYGFFRGKRGLRKGCPLSPYPFTLVMEILTRILHDDVHVDPSFRFHYRCDKQRIINLCFAGDLFIFAKGDVASATCIFQLLNKFARMSGLIPSPQKSTVYFCNVSNHTKDGILSAVNMVKGTLPVCYLSVPLISTRLRARDYAPLLDGLDNCISSWRNKFLSYAGRLQLINSGFSTNSSVDDVFNQEGDLWPPDWVDRFRVLNEITDTVLTADAVDQLKWKSGNNWTNFSSRLVWDSIRTHGPLVAWADFIWSWDSHGHLFFECTYSSQVWCRVREWTCLSCTAPLWADIAGFFVDKPVSSLEIIVAKLVVHASTYYIWQERNNRIFQNHATPDSLAAIIRDTMRSRLMGHKLRKTPRVCCILDNWEIGGSISDADGVT
ncbi:hypothetical protein SSX86_001768 [Deinandra increscens subsp. villosa]|uniref:Reverse transcriptase domain-containing protein n=1 Tax=Deinandra increscens subsp. villosa TaxID=3103831 RepID=A0AAP0DZR3_9ASTR